MTTPAEQGIAQSQQDALDAKRERREKQARNAAGNFRRVSIALLKLDDLEKLFDRCDRIGGLELNAARQAYDTLEEALFEELEDVACDLNLTDPDQVEERMLYEQRKIRSRR